MEVGLFNTQHRRFTMRGTCPHCSHPSAFVSACVHIDDNEWIAGMQCQGCMDYILAMCEQPVGTANLVYRKHYPLGKPDDTVADEIPAHIQPDFKEALRCRFVDAYNPTAEMCRRAVEASCLDLGAKGKVLDELIDSLASQQTITPFLQQVAHKIRLGGNRAAHPSEDASGPGAGPQPSAMPASVSTPITTIEKEHADAIIKFTREFFHHVYVVPKELAKYDFSKPKAAKS